MHTAGDFLLTLVLCYMVLPQISGAWGEPQEALGHPKGVLFLGERPVSEYNPGASETKHVAKWEDRQWPHAAQGEEKLG